MGFYEWIGRGIMAREDEQRQAKRKYEALMNRSVIHLDSYVPPPPKKWYQFWK
jgi:hypothetical protein